LQQFPGTTLAFQTIWEKDSIAVVHYGVSGKTPGGQAMGHEGLLFYEFDSAGLVSSEHRYLDSLTPIGQLGALGKISVRPPPGLKQSMTVLEAENSKEEASNQVIVAKTLNGLNAKNEAAFLSNFADNAEIDELICPQTFADKQGAESWFEMWSGAAEARTEAQSMLAAKEFVLVEAKMGGALKGPLGPLAAPSSATDFVVHRAAIFQIRDGKIVRLAFFMNGKELAQSVGQWPLASMKSR